MKLTQSTANRGPRRAAVIGAGPAGMACALGLLKIGYEVALFERYPEVKAAGNILNLWPSPQKALKALGVDITDLGAASLTQLQRFDGRKRADFVIPPEIVEEYHGGFIGLLRAGLYKRMLDTLPPGILRPDHVCSSISDRGRDVVVKFTNGEEFVADIVVGADGIDSYVRKTLWGDSPKRNHALHLIGGYFFTDEAIGTRGVFAHDKHVQGSYTPIRHEGRNGYEWWVLEAWEPDAPFTQDRKSYALDKVKHFAQPLPDFIRRTLPEHTHRWEIKDRPPIAQWSKGRITLVGDAAHATSPYAAYGAGMSVEDGYFLARALVDVDVADTVAVRAALQKFEDARKPHCSRVTQEAYKTGQLFHHTPKALIPLREFVFDRTPLMQHIHGTSFPKHILTQMKEISETLP